MIKIIYLTDIHDSIYEIDTLLQMTHADLYLISGDILYYAFDDIDTLLEFTALQEEFRQLTRMREKKIFPYDLAMEILVQKNYPDEELVKKSSDYRKLFHLAAKTMKEKYQKIENMIQKHSHADCFVLPGNYDIDLKYTALSHRNLHKKIMYFENLTFGGYGGAPVPTSGIPDKLIVPYLEGGSGSDFYSEPQEFFETHQPDILVLHNPAYGYFDRIPSMGNVGSFGIRNFIDSHTPLLVLSGHIHEDYGILINKRGTVFLNPSNFGNVDSVYGIMEGGTFAEIFIDEKKKIIERIQINRLHKDRIQEFFEVKFTKHPVPKMELRKLKDFDDFHLDFHQFYRIDNNSYY